MEVAVESGLETTLFGNLMVVIGEGRHRQSLPFHFSRPA